MNNYRKKKKNSESGQKSSYDDVIPAVDDFFYQWDLSNATPIEEVCGPQKELCWKINVIWSHSMRVSQSAHELFSQSL